MTRFVRIQLTIFAVVTVLALSVMSVSYLKLPTAFGWQRTDVALQMPDTGGVYKNANVSYLGNVIGRVDAVTLKPGHVVAELHFDTRAEVPENVRAQIRSVSAVGEQFVELVPEGEPVGEMADGTVLGEDRVDMPQGIGPVLDQATVLMASIDDGKMRRVISESFDAFNGSERELQQFLDSAQLLLEEAQRNTGATRQLIADAEPVLDSQLRSADSIRAWTRNLADLTDQLRVNEPQLTSIIQRGPDSLARATRVLNDLQPTMPVLVANLVSVGEVGVVYNRSIEQLLVIYPALVSSLITAINGAKDTGEIKVDFNLQINETPPCTTGFLPADQRRSPADLSVPPLMNGIYCKVPKDSQTTVRGARNLPCMEYPGRRAASPAECAADDYVPEGINPPDTSEVGPPGDSPNAYNVVPSSNSGEREIRTSAAMYDPATGEYLGANGKTYRQLNLGTASKLSADADLADILTNGVT
ncbi:MULTISPECIES: MCE family protein [Dietzia]|uniref:Mammalian cell entry protein n=1 Tax=Dietzia psychralcaliphila TaxID=139021 RepID=A0AAD0JNW6_9ACTN|nr:MULTISPECIES: MlaD family protein [Dietzia]AWH94717.1 mammalian cell entry protein [Dietzia psychralcaliphila]MBB1023825.1 MCE family protein [Dietzia sp. DQ12-76]MBB1028608.1 MCE family protein [Dietzia sp. DQ11-38-2]MBB1029517.1 MCE family protein [Dietzia sp. SLG310A2-38A2]MBB1033989.1 MCE family protein [Dietzia sp. CQ4]